MAATAPPAPVTFKDVAEARSALALVIEGLSGAQDELIKLIAECGDDQQMKMTKLIPRLQALLSEPMAKFGFPPGPPGKPCVALSYLSYHP